MLRLIAPLLPDIRRTFILISIVFISQPPSRTLFTTSSPSLHPLSSPLLRSILLIIKTRPLPSSRLVTFPFSCYALLCSSLDSSVDILDPLLSLLCCNVITSPVAARLLHLFLSLFHVIFFYLLLSPPLLP